MEGYLFLVLFFAWFCFFLGFWIPAYLIFLLLCFSAFPAFVFFLLLCFSASLFSAFCFYFLFLCFSVSLLFFFFCCFCFSVSLLLCFSCFSAFPASLLFISSFLLFAFPASLLFCYCASVPFYLYYSTFSFLQSCVFAAPLPAPLLLYFPSLPSLCFPFSFAFFFPVGILNWKPRATLGETQRNPQEILIKNPDKKSHMRPQRNTAIAAHSPLFC